MPLPDIQAQALFESFQHVSKKKDADCLACIESFLDRGIALKEVIDKGGNTLLHQATARGKKDVVRELIMQGLDPLKLNDFGKSSVGIAEDFRGCGKAYRETFSFLSVEGQALAIEMAAKAAANPKPTSKRKRGESDLEAEKEEEDGPKAATRAKINAAAALLGKRVTMEFPGYGYYEGIVTCDEGERGLRVDFEDKTIEYLPMDDVVACIERYEQWHGKAGAATARTKKKKDERQPEKPKVSNKNHRKGKPGLAVPAEGDHLLKKIQVLWDDDSTFYAGLVTKVGPKGLEGRISVKYDHGSNEDIKNVSSVIVVEQVGVRWAKQAVGPWWPAMVWQSLEERHSSWSFVQFLGKNTFAWLMDTVVITFDDGLESHLDGITQIQGTAKEMSEAEAAVEEAFEGMKEVSERKLPEYVPPTPRASGPKKPSKSRKKSKAPRERRPPAKKPEPVVREYVEEEFVTVTGPPLYPVPLVGSNELEVDFATHGEENEEASMVLKRLYAWVTKRSYLDWGLTSSSSQMTMQRTCRVLKDKIKTNDAYGRVTEGYFKTSQEHTDLLKEEIKKIEEVESNTQGSEGYGEVTQGSVTRLVCYLNSLRALALEKLPMTEGAVLDDKWDLGPQSSFLDIGSGYGKVVFHIKHMAKVQKSVGIECVFSRDQIAAECLAKLKEGSFSLPAGSGDATEVDSASKPKSSEQPMELDDGAKDVEGAAPTAGGVGAVVAKAPVNLDLSGMKFILGDASADQYMAQGHDFTHIYLFDRVFAKVTLRSMAKVLNASPFRVMVSSKHWRVWWGYGLLKIQPIGKMRVYTTGKECITIFIYINTDLFPGIYPEPEPEEEDISEGATEGAQEDGGQVAEQGEAEEAPKDAKEAAGDSDTTCESEPKVVAEPPQGREELGSTQATNQPAVAVVPGGEKGNEENVPQ